VKIIAVRKNKDGDITDFRMDNGQELNYSQALQMAKEGQIDQVDVFQKYGREIIRSEPDLDISNNLDNLPTF